MARKGLGFEAALTRLGLTLVAAGTLHLGCSADIVDSSSSGSFTGSGGAGGGVTHGEGGAASSSSSSSASSSSGGPVDACTTGQLPSKEPLCGTPYIPCKVLALEVLPSDPAFRNDAPSIRLDEACTPTILYSAVDNNTFQGFTAWQKAPGSWQTAGVPFPVVTGTLLGDPPGSALILANDGEFNTSLWGFTAEGWKVVTKAPGKVTHWATGAARAQDGGIHAGFFSDTGELIRGTFYDGWTMEKLGEAVSPVGLALSPEGKPHIVTWSPEGQSWVLNWYPPSGPAEVLLTYGYDLELSLHRQVIAVGPKDEGNPKGKPHVLALHSTPDAGNKLIYFTRVEFGSWFVYNIESSADRRLLPLAVLTGPSGDVRLLYATQSYSDETDGEIYVASINENFQVDKLLVAKSVAVVGGTATQDSLGHIHMALYTQVAADKYDVRYMLLGK